MEQERVSVKIYGVFLHEGEKNPQHFILFVDDNGRRMPIWVGPFEAWSSQMALEGVTPDRPFTHDAMMLFLEAAGASIEEAYINDLRGETFYASVRLRTAEGIKEIDIRPSDAVALAIRAKCPIFISEGIMQLGKEAPPKTEAKPSELPPAEETPQTLLQRCQSAIGRLGKQAEVESDAGDHGDADKT